MITEAELIIDRRRLRRRLTLWRIAAIVLAALAIGALLWTPGNIRSFEDHIARIRIDGLITGDQATLNLLDDIAESKKVQAVIIRIDSPGGTTAGSEAIYESIRKIAKDKPVAAVMDTVAASGGYITAIAADHIVARGNTITGSIGVIFSFPEVSRLLDTLGIRMEEIKSGDLKAEPSPYKPVSDKARSVSQVMVQDGFDWFTGLVAERRGLPIARVRELSDGRVYTGRQAIAVKLIDELGGEEKAVEWLQSEKKLGSDLKIIDWTARKITDPTGLGFSAESALLRLFGLERLAATAERAKLDGLLALWHPDL
ncbi:MAG: signal peptide peptidase SppA [Alphaproteobacteria bacterium]|nr:signal peptide peptidase SppA [Alphaproteobacteria bacterium]